jgi:hypothetical protein
LATTSTLNLASSARFSQSVIRFSLLFIRVLVGAGAVTAGLVRLKPDADPLRVIRKFWARSFRKMKKSLTRLCASSKRLGTKHLRLGPRLQIGCELGLSAGLLRLTEGHLRRTMPTQSRKRSRSLLF